MPSNVRITDDTFAAHIEPAIAVNPADPRNLLVACRVFPGPDAGARVGVAAYASFDGGTTWRGHGLLPGLVPDFDGNPTVAFDGRGRGYVCCVVAGRGRPRRGDVLLWRTDDGGRRFHPPVTAVAGGPGLADHPSLAIGAGCGTSHACLHLAAARYGTGDDGVVLTRSFDGGRTFEPPRGLDADAGARAIAPVAAAGPDGSLTVAYLTGSRGGVALRSVASADGGETFTAPVTVAEVPAMAPGLGDVTAKSGPALAAAPGGGLVCAALTAFDEATGVSRLLLATSGGPTSPAPAWSSPLAVAAGGDAILLQPQVAVGADRRIAISVYALSVTSLRMDVQLHVSAPVPAGSCEPPSFGPPLRVTTRSFDPRRAVGTGDTRWLGNYQALAASPGQVFRPAWTDTRTGRPHLFTARLAAVADPPEVG